MKTLRAVCFVLSMCTAAFCQCETFRYKKGPNFSSATLRKGVLRIAVRPSEFSIARLFCFGRGLKEKHPDWQIINIEVFSSNRAAKNFVSPGTDAGAMAYRWKKYLFASYDYNASEGKEYILMTPFGFETREPLATTLDLTRGYTDQCRIALSGRCALLLDPIEYPADLRHKGITGAVSLAGTITPGGRITDIHLVGSNITRGPDQTLLTVAATQNLTSWQLERRSHSDPIQVTYTFVVEGPSTNRESFQFELPDRILVKAWASD